ncbi:hypothetical protein [Qingshengfaniella alkalisoli]|uniref:Uncharacterized protein n=1 Tax=Qingshengfaniella alkalisoli TaxID=2599296 RepID=A0A5B8I7N7_9RHOB|nr:hypothetical protein [Qingshengfaniella alkalisoli]QDY68526.1 hypothetical protein FPZ52_02090 [Qingshengfaniella alkalisoli]
MQFLIWIGAAMSLIGMAGIIGCISTVAKARKTSTSDEELRVALQQVVPRNLFALLISAIGLICVVLGIAFG